MVQFVDVPNFFETVYLVDLSPSLCRVAEDRFCRLGWKNIKVICDDARRFRLEDYIVVEDEKSTIEHMGKVQADLVTMSYSLSMIPEFYAVVDSLSELLSSSGVVGVADFYVQSEVDYHSRNYIGGEINRHCMWISRVFWRTWFEADRVSLEAARRVSPVVWPMQALLIDTGLLGISFRNHHKFQRTVSYVWSSHTLLRVDRMLQR